MEDREVRVTPHCLQWSAYYPEMPHERAIGDSPTDAMQRLRDLAGQREKQMAVLRQQSLVSQRKRNAAIFASIFLVGLLATAFIVQATANSSRARVHGKIYAHRTAHKTHRSHTLSH